MTAKFSEDLTELPVAAREADFSAVSANSAGPAGNLEDEICRQHSGARILVVDDVELNLEIAQLLLHRVGLQVDTAMDGRQAVDMARNTAYAAVLMDVQMPEMDGLQATRAIRQLPGRAGTPILAITANAFAEHRRQCFDAGMDAFITKPVDSDTLYTALKKWLGAGTKPQAALADRGQALPAEPRPRPAPVIATTALRQRLAAVVGLDIDNGLARVRGNESKYAQVLALFVHGHEPDLSKIPQALRSGERSAAEQLIHALKGTAGLIGATAVARAAAALLVALQQQAGREEIDLGYSELATRLGQLIDGLKQAQDSEPATALASVTDPAHGAEVLRNLEADLAAGDMRAAMLARTEASLLRALLGDAAAALLAAIEVFDYERALAQLRAAKEKLAQLE